MTQLNLPSPTTGLVADAVEAYERASASLRDAERAAAATPAPDRERRLLALTDLVLACRVSALRALAESTDALDSRIPASLALDERLLALPPEVDEPWLFTSGNGICTNDS